MSEKQPSAVPDIEPTIDEPDIDPLQGSEAEQEQQNDAETRYTDKEILGKSYMVRAQVYERGKNRIQRTYEGVLAAAGNLKDTPGMLKKTFLHNRAESSHNRKEARLQTAIENGASERLIARRRTAASKAENHKENRLKEKDEHSNRMEKRRTNVISGFENRKTAYLDHYKDKKTNAEARKALRKQLKSEGAGIRERRAIVAEMPQEQLKQVGRVAVSAEVSRRKEKQAGRAEKKLDKEVKNLKTDRQIAEKRAASHLDQAAKATKIVGEIEGQSAATQAEISELSANLSMLSPEDPSYGDIQAELEEAKETAAVQKRNLDYWSKTAKKHEEQAASQKSLAKDLKAERKLAKSDLEDARGTVVERAGTSETDRLATEKAVKEALSVPEQKDKETKEDEDATTEQTAA